MNITKHLVKSVAESYTAEQLRQKRCELIEKLSELEYVSSASTGSGASYTMAERAKVEELIELYSMALEYQSCGDVQSTGIVHRVIFY